MAFLIGVIITILVIVGIGYGVVYFNKKMNTMTFSKYDKSELDDIKNTQDLLPFKDIKVNRVDLGDFRYVAYLKVEPFNYLICSEDGKDSFAIRLRRAFNSIDFPISLFTHTRKMVTDNMLQELSKTMEETLIAHPEQRQYADEYFRYLSFINIRNPQTGELRRIKEYFIVIPWEPSSEISHLGDREIEIRAKEELRQRVYTVREELKNAGVLSNHLNTIEIIYLLTSIYRREETNKAEMLFKDNEEYLSIMVEGDEETHYMLDEKKLASIIEGARTNIESEILNNPTIQRKIRNKGLKITEILTNLESKI